MSKAHKSRYLPVHPDKYKGDPNIIFCRSSWERALCRWLDHNPNVKRWSSEEDCIPYICKTDGMAHRYFVDFYIEFVSGKTLLVEVKPHNQTKPPAVPKRKTKVYVEQVMTYAKNVSKWQAAIEHCKLRNWEFRVWDEHALKKLGVLTS